MAIAHVNSNTGAVTGSTTITVSITPSGSDKIVLAIVGGQSFSSFNVTGVTYDGNAMTQVGTEIDKGTGTMSFWYYLNPANGPKNVVATYNGTINGVMVVTALSGVDQTAPDASGQSDGNAASASNTLTSLVANSWYVDGIGVEGDKTLAPGTGQTERGEINQASWIDVALSTEEVASASENSSTYSWTGSIDYGYFTVVLAPAGAAGTNLTLPLLSVSPTLHAPTVAVGNINLTVPLLSASTTLYAPTVTLDATVLELPLIASTTTLYAPTVAVGNINLTVPLLANTTTLHAPSLALNLDIQAPLLASATALYAPSVSMGNINLAVPLIASATTLYAPTVTTGNIDVSLPLLASATTLYTPSIGLNLDLSLPLIASTTTLYAPSLSMGNINLAVPLIASATTLYTPTVVFGDIDLSLPLIASTTTLYAPIVVPSLKIFEDDMVVGSNENLDDHIMDLPVSEGWTNLQGQTIVVRASDDVAVMADQAANEWVVYIADTTNFSDEKQYAEADVKSTDTSAQNARVGVGCRMVSSGANDKGIFAVLRGELLGTRRVSLYLMTDDATIELPDGGNSETTFAWSNNTTYRIRLEVRNLPTANNVRAKIFVDDVLIHTETFVNSDIYSNNGRPGIIGRVATSWGPTDENTLTNFEAGYVGAELELPLLTAATTLYAPEVFVAADVVLTMPLLVSTAVLYAPSITFPATLEMPVISSTTSLFAPTLLPGAISVTLPFLSASSVLYAPVLTFLWNDVDNPSSPIWADVDSVTTPSWGDTDSPTTPTWEDVD